jgi:hypothetical protein
MRSNSGAFLGLRLVLISSATSVGVASGILSDNADYSKGLAVVYVYV